MSRRQPDNPQKLMKTRTGQVMPKPRGRRRKRGGAHPVAWPAICEKRPAATRWFATVRDLFGGR